jgi:hypothetical protein
MFDVSTRFQLLKGNHKEQAIFITFFLIFSICPAIDLTQFRVPYATASIKGWTFDLNSGAQWERYIEGDYRSSWFSIKPGYFWQTKTTSDNVDLSVEIPSFLECDYRDNTYSGIRVRSGDLSIKSLPVISWSRYIKTSDFFFGAKLNGDLSINGSTYNGDGQKWSYLSLKGETNSQLGFGYGRFRDAWPLFKAIRITEVLDEEGMLKQKLSDDRLLELADFISRAWKLFYAHERPARFYYDSLEYYLLNTGAISQRLPAYMLFRLDEGLALGSYSRPFGKKIYVGAKIRADGKMTINCESNQAHTYLYRRNDIYPVAELSYARPLGLRWTTLVSAIYQLSFQRQPFTHSFALNLKGGYQITDRILLNADMKLSTVYYQPVSSDNNEFFRLSSSTTLGTNYYLENRFSVEAGLGWFYELYSTVEQDDEHDGGLGLYLSLRFRPFDL